MVRDDKFVEYRQFFITTLKQSGISFGIHFSQTKNRIDIHFWNKIYHIGKVPIYKIKTKTGERLIAVSDYFHSKTEEIERKYLGI